MKESLKHLVGRRSFFKSFGMAAGAGAATLLTDADLEGAVQNVNRSSIPSQLKITDLRVAEVKDAEYNLAWMEDMIPWQMADLWKQITESVNVPTLTGEDIYLKEDFAKLVRARAVDIIHPDLTTSGGILETKKIGDLAMEGGVPMAMHFAGTPVSFMANVHCAAATENFLVLEAHSVDVPFWEDFVTGIPKPIVQKGYVMVPEKPGLSIELNEELIRQHLREPGHFEPTPEWDKERSWDRLWS